MNERLPQRTRVSGRPRLKRYGAWRKRRWTKKATRSRY
jgi:hypothetical protein